MTEPFVNRDRFVHRPSHTVVGILDDPAALQALLNDMQRIGIAAGSIDVLSGERGADILDKDGHHHGIRAELVRALQQLGYDQTTLALYNEALRGGALLVHVPSTPRDRRLVADLLWRHGANNIGYFGSGTFEQFTFTARDV